ncbi:MAG TPA: cell envelope integrity protein CreD [Cyclobacteriaceae bacterium]
METNNQLNLLDRFNSWLKASITVKLGSIGFLTLILLIPSALIQELMRERQQRADEVTLEVARKWSASQTVSGPVLVIPYGHLEEYKFPNNEVQTKETIVNAYFLPETLHVSGKVNPETLHRGIFDVAVYNATFSIQATFANPDFKKLNIDESRVKWNEAYVVNSISDLKGINTAPQLSVGNAKLATEPSNNIGFSIPKFSEVASRNEEIIETPVLSKNGIKARLNWSAKEDFESAFTLDLDLKGSSKLSFVPIGKTTDVQLSGAWGNPSFDGEFLPTNREVTENNFSADWKVLHFNRAFDQAWTGQDMELANSTFGVKLLIPVDQYQKSIRSSKYSILIIVLTFVSLFLVEIISKVRIHPFQYILIGAALIIYYTLLISLSEFFGYNVAYWMATALTVALLTFYSISFMPRSKYVYLFSVIVFLSYTFIFVIIIQQDLSLLIGSLGLFIITGLIMYFSRKIDWYGEG